MVRWCLNWPKLIMAVDSLVCFIYLFRFYLKWFSENWYLNISQLITKACYLVFAIRYHHLPKPSIMIDWIPSICLIIFNMPFHLTWRWYVRRSFADRIECNHRKDDSRSGYLLPLRGEEFSFTLPQTEHRAAMIIAKRVRRRIDQKFKNTSDITVSIGCAMCPVNAKSAKVLIKKQSSFLLLERKW